MSTTASNFITLRCKIKRREALRLISLVVASHCFNIVCVSGANFKNIPIIAIPRQAANQKRGKQPMTY